MKNRIFRAIMCALLVLPAMTSTAQNPTQWLAEGNEKYGSEHFEEAIALYTKAATAGLAEAQFNLGMMFYQGEGAQRDYTSAATWFKRAARQRYARAEYQLACCYMSGNGVPVDYEQALMYMRAAALRGYTPAQSRLAQLYEKGILVEADSVESHRWQAMAEGKKVELAPEEERPNKVTPTPTLTDITVSKTPPRSKPKVALAEAEQPQAAQPSTPAKTDVAETGTELAQAVGTPTDMSATEAQDDAPSIRILYPEDQSSFHADVVKIKYQLLAKGLESSTKVTAMVDGVRQPESRAVRQANTLEVDVPDHDCTIMLFAQNERGNSIPAVIRLKREKAVQVDLPRLFAVCVGVGEYTDEKLPPLAMSVKDAEDFAAAIQAKKGHPFSDVQVKLLTDWEATRGDIFEAMQWMGQEARPNDLCMFFFAGHGYRDERDRFFFMPFGANTSRTYECFSATDFKDAAEKINSKFIVFADACYSAGLLEGNRSAAATHFVEQLRRSKNGMLFYASSSGDTKSKEDPDWGNGAFTKALLEAFDGAARKDEDEGLSTRALDAFLYDTVRLITDYKQTPVFMNPSGIEHFNIFTYDEE